MSRTIRKQSGDRYWRNSGRTTWKYINNRWLRVPSSIEDIKEDIINNERKENKEYKSFISKAIKWHSNMLVRSRNRIELHKVLQDPENYDYDRSHDLLKRGIWWIYD